MPATEIKYNVSAHPIHVDFKEISWPDLIEVFNALVKFKPKEGFDEKTSKICSCMLHHMSLNDGNYDYVTQHADTEFVENMHMCIQHGQFNFFHADSGNPLMGNWEQVMAAAHVTPRHVNGIPQMPMIMTVEAAKNRDAAAAAESPDTMSMSDSAGRSSKAAAGTTMAAEPASTAAAAVRSTPTPLLLTTPPAETSTSATSMPTPVPRQVRGGHLSPGQTTTT